MEKLPADVTAVESRVQVDGNAITSRGAGTGMEFSLALVEKLYGKDKADEVGTPMVSYPYFRILLLTIDHRVTGLRRPVTRSDTYPVTASFLAVTTASLLAVTTASLLAVTMLYSVSYIYVTL